MYKKIIGLVFALFLAVVIIIVTFYLRKQKEYKNVNMLSAIPISSELIVQIDNIESIVRKFRTKPEVLEELKCFDFFADIDDFLREIKFLTTDYSIDTELSLDRALTISSHLQGRNSIQYLYVLPINDYIEQKKILNSILDWTKKSHSVAKKKYNDEYIYTLRPKNKLNNAFFFAFNKGLLLVSKSTILIESSIRQSSSNKSLTDIRGFKKVNKTRGKNVDANIFINVKQAQKLTNIHLDRRYRGLNNNLKNFADWIELDLNIRDKVILLNGFSFSDAVNSNIMQLLQSQSPIKFDAMEIIPRSANLIAMLGISDNEEYIKTRKEYLSKHNSLNYYNSYINNIQKRSNKNIEKLIFKLLYKELVMIYTAKSPNNSFTLMRTRSKAYSEDFILDFIESYAKEHKKTADYYTHIYNPDINTNYRFYTLPDDRIISHMFGNAFAESSSKYMSFIGNYILFGDNYKEMAKFMNESARGNTIENDDVYEKDLEYLSDKGNFLLYAKAPRIFSYFSKYLRNKDIRDLKLFRSQIDKFRSFGVQVNSSNFMNYNNLFLTYDSVAYNPIQTNWELKIDSKFEHKPIIVKNHNTKENEILIHDENRNLYLITNNGHLLWKKRIKENIIGDIYQIDYYKNDKLQYIFATENYLFLIDRNGNFVENYPIQLPASTKIGISMYDYSNTKDYRIFVPCIDNKVYLYDKRGKDVVGWSKPKAENEINSKIYFFSVKSRDYIVYSDEFRIYIMNRKGKERVRPKIQYAKAINSRFYISKDASRENDVLVCSDENGYIRECKFNGDVNTIETDIDESNHRLLVADYNSDGINEFIFGDGEYLKIFDHNGNLILEREFESTISQDLKLYSFSYNNKQIGVTIEDENKVYLIDKLGNTRTNFPMKGNTNFSICYEKNKITPFQMYVGSEDNFLLNYSLN
ncbi:MAG: DUF3352 domain-containing protein [Marinifilaceae bacterium]|jgi:hypothetical protein|nr:DUF3352 domain-containing protein [Marinifilaceae bacterium]